jgi:hypothetical protein
MTSSTLAKIKQQLWPRESGRDIWMIVDGARDRAIYGVLLDSYLEYSCLYHGELSPELEVAAPYLVHLDYDDSYSNKLMERAWGNSWGVFLKCDSRVDALRRHLRTLLTVRDEKGSSLLFRYYDPRVLRVYLPTCWPEELKTVYGPITAFWTEDRTASILQECRFQRGQLVQNEIPVESGAVSSSTETIQSSRPN